MRGSHVSRPGRYLAGPLSVVLICLLVCCACGGSSAGGPAPARFGASESTLNRDWKVDPQRAACVHENLTLTCFYLYRSLHIAVAFDSHERADQITVDGHRHRGIDEWAFLNGLVPGGERRTSCRYVPHSDGGDTAHACLYHGKLNLIVAYFSHPADPTFGGIVTYDYAGYLDIE